MEALDRESRTTAFTGNSRVHFLVAGGFRKVTKLVLVPWERQDPDREYKPRKPRPTPHMAEFIDTSWVLGIHRPGRARAPTIVLSSSGISDRSFVRTRSVGSVLALGHRCARFSRSKTIVFVQDSSLLQAGNSGENFANRSSTLRARVRSIRSSKKGDLSRKTFTYFIREHMYRFSPASFSRSRNYFYRRVLARPAPPLLIYIHPACLVKANEHGRNPIENPRVLSKSLPPAIRIEANHPTLFRLSVHDLVTKMMERRQPRRTSHYSCIIHEMREVEGELREREGESVCEREREWDYAWPRTTYRATCMPIVSLLLSRVYSRIPSSLLFRALAMYTLYSVLLCALLLLLPLRSISRPGR